MKLPGFVGLLSPQVWLAVGLALVLALAAAGATGYRLGTKVQTGKDAAALSAKDKLIASKNVALTKAAERFRAYAEIFRGYNAESARWKAESDAAAKRASAAENAASEAERRLHDNQTQRAAAERRARQRPGCAALLDMDVDTELRKCGMR